MLLLISKGCTIVYYYRIGGKGYGFLLPEDAEKLREFFAEHQEPAALEKTSSANATMKAVPNG